MNRAPYITVRRQYWRSWNSRAYDGKRVSFTGTYRGPEGLVEVYWERFHPHDLTGKEVGGIITYSALVGGMDYTLTERGERPERGIAIKAGRLLRAIHEIQTNRQAGADPARHKVILQRLLNTDPEQ